MKTKGAWAITRTSKHRHEVSVMGIWIGKNANALATVEMRRLEDEESFGIDGDYHYFCHFVSSDNVDLDM